MSKKDSDLNCRRSGLLYEHQIFSIFLVKKFTKNSKTKNSKNTYISIGTIPEIMCAKFRKIPINTIGGVGFCMKR